MLKPLIFLASASPRRSELLRQIAVSHEVRPVSVDETRQPREHPGEYVVRLAIRKADELWGRLAAEGRRPVLGADTAVVIDGEILGKPRDRAHALSMLARLSGRSHEVYTGVALRYGDETSTRLSISEVSFRALLPAEAQAYWDSGEPVDKAGAYAVQGLAAVFIARIAGSYSGIMGLPLFETAELLRCVGVAAASAAVGRAR